MAGINPLLRLYDDTYDDKSYTDVNRLANALLTQADVLSPIVTMLYGQFSQRFPLMLLTEGRNRIKTIKSVDSVFKVPVMGKPKKTSIIVSTTYTSTSTPGLGQSEFYVVFADRWFEKTYLIESPILNIQAQIVAEPIQVQDGWRYTLKLTGSNVNAFCPVSELQPNLKWGAMFAPAGISGSRGNGSRNQAPSMMQNACTFIRKSYSYKGNVQNKVMVIEVPTESGTVKYWSEMEAYQHALQWKEECENVLWYSRWNKDSNGTNQDKDPNSGEDIIMGSGLLQQIPNTSTYSFLTAEKIKRVMRDVFFNSMPGEKKDIQIFVGTGSREAFSDALQKAFTSLGLIATQDKFIAGEGPQSLTYGSYFGTYRHVDGHTATIRYLPLLDKGVRAEKANKHPITGLPITSYDMYFIDMTPSEGRSNVEYVAEEGRQDIEVFVPGLTIPKGYSVNTLMRASDIDGSSVHFAKSLGIQMYNPVNSFILTCNAS